jgi:hypothetical protein
MVGFDAETITAALAVVMFLFALFGLTTGDIQLAGIAFFVVALLIFAREEYF